MNFYYVCVPLRIYFKIMRKKLLTIFGCLSSLIGFAQNDCVTTFTQVQSYLLGSTNGKPDYAKAYTMMQDCVSQGNPSALFLSAFMLLNGLGVEKDENLAFKYMMKAAIEEHATAEYYMGVFYRAGTGCDIDYVSSIYWLCRSSQHGNQEATYLMGYNFLKGLGVPQNYECALSWFGISTDPMAKYWLGNCYYFGYGVPKNTQKAIEYYTQSNTPASKELLKHIGKHALEKAEATTENQLGEKDAPQNTAIAREVVEKLAIETSEQHINKINLKDRLENGKLKDKPVQDRVLKAKYLNGKWKGKLIELEWSGTQITQVLPLQCEFLAYNGKVNYKWETGKTKSEAAALWEDNALYFDKLNMVFDLPFSDDPNIKTIDWQVVSTQLEFKTINKKTYLIGNLETYSPILKEPGPPMRIILKQMEEGEDEEITDSELLALSRQKGQFIALYPNPFVNDVRISYTLDAAAMVSVNIYDLTGNPAPITLEPGAMQTAGEHHYTLDGSKLHAGMYIVRVATGKQMYSRILIKQ